MHTNETRNKVFNFELYNLWQEDKIVLKFRVTDPEHNFQKQHQNQI